MRKISICLLTIFLLAATAWAGEVINRVAAVVDDDIITMHEVEQMAAPIIAQIGQDNPNLTAAELNRRGAKIKRQILRTLIEEKLIEAEINRLGIEVTEAEIDAYIERVKKANDYTDETLSIILIQQGMSMADFRDRVKMEILREQYVSFRLRDKLRVRDEDVRAYYNNHPDQFAAEPVVTIAEIRINLPPEATEEQTRAVFVQINTIYEQLLAGADFHEMAQQHSQGPTAANGGVLGEFKLNSELKTVYRKAVTPLEEGRVSTIHRDQNGFFILKLIEKNLSGLLPFEEVQDRIRMVLRKQKAELEMERLATELYRKSYVEILVQFTPDGGVADQQPSEPTPEPAAPQPPNEP